MGIQITNKPPKQGSLIGSNLAWYHGGCGFNPGKGEDFSEFKLVVFDWLKAILLLNGSIFNGIAFFDYILDICDPIPFKNWTCLVFKRFWKQWLPFCPLYSKTGLVRLTRLY